MTKNKNWELYTCHRWRQLRIKIIEKAKGRCKHCGNTGMMEVDHIIPSWKYDGDFYDEKNLQLLCRSCHFLKTKRDGHGCKEKSKWSQFVSDTLLKENLFK